MTPLRPTLALLVPGLLASAIACAQNAPQPMPPQIDPQSLPLTSESDLNVWCEQEARARYVAKNITTYQWTSRYYNRSNMLYVEGALRAHGEDIPVHCHAGTGARRRDAVIEIDDALLR